MNYDYTTEPNPSEGLDESLRYSQHDLDLIYSEGYSSEPEAVCPDEYTALEREAWERGQFESSDDTRVTCVKPTGGPPSEISGGIHPVWAPWKRRVSAAV